MLARLRIRQKLAVLLAIPLVAVALVMTVFSVDRVAEARAYGATAEAALAARDVGGLIQTLQQERLLALGYLALPTLDRSAIVRQGQTAVADTARLAAAPRTAEIIGRARPQLDALDEIRPSIVDRTATPAATFNAFRVTIATLMESLDLTRFPVADAQGLREMLALDALMRSNEDASSIGAIVVAASLAPSFDSTLLRSAMDSNTLNLSRFRQLVSPEQASLVDTVEGGAAALRLLQHVITVLSGNRPETQAAISEALTAALTYTGLRRLAQDRVARDAALAAQRDATTAASVAVGVAVGAAVLFLSVLALAIMVGRSISRPLRRLGRAVGAVAELSRAELVRVADSEAFDTAPPALASVEVDSDDEIGDLASAVNRVQSTAALLLERQATARANVATMFANVSRRTQNLVGRQLQMIDELARQERDPAARERLLRLQHTTTRLRRSADSLLVVSGTIDQQISAMPARLAAVLEAALNEIEGYQRVEVVEPIADVALGAELAADLRLLIAELLENAANFTPPGSSIQVGAAYDRDSSFAADCTIAVVDHGLGMSPARMEEENRRLIERERLDVVPTRVLGLFVVGRLARRHGLTVRLEPTPGRGVTVLVRIPSRWLTPASAPSGPAGLGVVPPLVAAAIESAARSGPFPWLADRPTSDAEPVTGAPVGAVPALGAPVGAVRHRVPVSGVPAGATPPPPLAPAAASRGRATRDPEAERAELDDYLSGLARAAEDTTAEPAGGLPAEPAGDALSEPAEDALSEPVGGPPSEPADGSPSEPTVGVLSEPAEVTVTPTAPPGPILEDTPPDPTTAPTLVERHP